MSRGSLVAAIDQGTTSTRCLIFDHGGGIVGSAKAEHAQLTPRPGWLEHDPLEIWANTCAVIERALSLARASGGDLAAVGITNQRETTLLWDPVTGLPLYNAIVWQDARTDEICRKLAEKDSIDRFRRQTGLPLSTYFSAPKLKWLLDNASGAAKAAAGGRVLFGTMDSWLIWNLTGGSRGGKHVSDVTNASRTMLMDLATLNWSAELLDAFGVEEGLLPEIRPSSDPFYYGLTCREGPFKAEIPVCAALGDQQAALVGQACLNPGEAKNTYGTGCFLLMNVGEAPPASKNGLLSTVAYKFGNGKAVYALEGSVAVAGSAVQWLRDNLGIIKNSGDIEALAASVPDNGDVYFVPAFSGLLAPHWQSDARGAILGLTRHSTAAHLARATLEAVAYQTLDVIAAMEADSGKKLKVLKADGGMVENRFFMQLVADILDAGVVRPASFESTALGAAFAAGLANGFWSDPCEITTLWQKGEEWAPSGDRLLHAANYKKWRKALTKAAGWATSGEV